MVPCRSLLRPPERQTGLRLTSVPPCLQLITGHPSQIGCPVIIQRRHLSRHAPSSLPPSSLVIICRQLPLSVAPDLSAILLQDSMKDAGLMFACFVNRI